MTTVQVHQKLLTDAWQDDAWEVTAEVRAFTRRRAPRSRCRVVLFEVPGDRDLHVNVIHQRSASTPPGWSGPGVTAVGFVHNRRFDVREPARIARHIQEMVYAPRDPSPVLSGAR